MIPRRTVAAALRCAALACALLAGSPVHAAVADASTTALDRFLDGLVSLQTTFTQTVTDARGHEVSAGSGTLKVLRPGRFRWQFQPRDGGSDSEQLLVADGANLWFYDQELEQVTVRPLQQALTATPMLLLSGTGTDMRASFDIAAAPTHDGLEWVDVRARGQSAEFSAAQLGFKGDELQRMVVHDRLGQTVTLQFRDSRRNRTIPAAQFQFTPPPGADVIGKPELK